MKKFGLLLGSFLIFAGLTIFDSGLKDIYTLHGGARVCFYITAAEGISAGDYADSDGISVIRNGAGIIVDAPGERAAALRNGLSDIKGESVVFEGGYDNALAILRLYRVRLSNEEIIPLGGEGNDILVFYGSSRLLAGGVSVDGVKVNIQIAVNFATGRVTVGTPLILGSY